MRVSSFSRQGFSIMPSSRLPYRGRNPWRRGFSDRSGDGDDAFVSGDSHFRTVRDANYSFRQGGRGNYRDSGRFPPQPFHPRPRFGQPAQQPPFGAPLQRPPFPQPQQRPSFRPPPPRPDDYRHWQYALSQPLSDRELFVVLSYNILADCLAREHRSRLYYHIPSHVLDWEWRKRRILIELGLWSPDIMCLQEVDRFQDLEEELKLKGYSGIWKMRTGKPIDGCAIFWLTRRFNLLHEEHIEFNNLGLRDNIAQICVFESTNRSPADNGPSLSATSSDRPKNAHQVVVCNIHVLYNPNRGDIKLAQVRVLLERAHAVSKIWNDAPVVICGDFNSTPKSPLYNFISEQKLDLSALAKNQVSGQSSAQINAPFLRGQNLDRGLFRVQAPSDTSVRQSVGLDDKAGVVNQTDIDMNSQNHSQDVRKDESVDSNSSYSQEMKYFPDQSTSILLHDENNGLVSDVMAQARSQEHLLLLDHSGNECESSECDLIGPLKETRKHYSKQNAAYLHLEREGNQQFNLPTTSLCNDLHTEIVESEHAKKDGDAENADSNTTPNEQYFQSNVNASDEQVRLDLDLSSEKHKFIQRHQDLSAEVSEDAVSNLNMSDPVPVMPQEDAAFGDAGSVSRNDASFGDHQENLSHELLTADMRDHSRNEGNPLDVSACADPAIEKSFSNLSLCKVVEKEDTNSSGDLEMAYSSEEMLMCRRKDVSSHEINYQNGRPEISKCSEEYSSMAGIQKDQYPYFEANKVTQSFSVDAGQNVPTCPFCSLSEMFDLNDADKLHGKETTQEVGEELASCMSSSDQTLSSSLRSGSEPHSLSSLELHIVENKEEGSDMRDSTSPYETHSYLLNDGTDSDLSPPMDSRTSNAENNAYDPCIWTPEEIEMASGNAECTLVQHPLKLNSTYTEVEDYAGTKDSSKEPKVTSYHRQFMGTVDYIWHSEGLQAVKVLDTIPVHVLQRTRGFPTRKWGSDHLALVCQLAFTEELQVEDS